MRFDNFGRIHFSGASRILMKEGGSDKKVKMGCLLG